MELFSNSRHCTFASGILSPWVTVTNPKFTFLTWQIPVSSGLMGDELISKEYLKYQLKAHADATLVWVQLWIVMDLTWGLSHHRGNCLMSVSQWLIYKPGKSLNVSVPQFPRLANRDASNTYVIHSLWRCNELIAVMHWKWLIASASTAQAAVGIIICWCFIRARLTGICTSSMKSRGIDRIRRPPLWGRHSLLLGPL